MNISNSQDTSSLLNKAQSAQQTQFQRISSAKQINSAKDDAAGLVMATQLDSQSLSISAALKNNMDGISRIQVEDGALSSVSEDLQKIRELSLQQQNGTLNEEGRQAIQSEIDQRLESIDSALGQTEFNGKSVFEEGDVNIQAGSEVGQTINIGGEDIAAQFSSLGVAAGGGEINLDSLDSALELVSQRRSELGASESRLESNSEFLALKNEQNQSASSRIQDTDFAKALAEKSKADVQVSVIIGVQAQANQNQESVLRLLKS